jgi:L-malate glycosyltransferase
MHLLEIVSAKKSNGVVTHLRQLLPALAARGHRVTVLTREGSSFAEEFSAMGLETLSSDLHRWPGDELERIGEWAKAEKVDVIHAHMSRANNFGVRLQQKTGIPCVLTAHALVWHPHWRAAARVIAVSEATERWHRRWNRVSKIETVLNFVDPAKLAPSDGTRERIRAEWGVAEGEFLFGTIGDLIPRKGVDVLASALGKLGTPAKTVFVGRGEEKFVEKLKRAAGERAIWAGFRTDIPDVLAALDGFALASRRDPCPMAVIEAMAAGLPVVGSCVDGIPEFVDEGFSGFLARPGDPADLARALGCLAVLTPETRRRMGEFNREFVTANATAESQVPKIEAALRKVCR